MPDLAVGLIKVRDATERSAEEGIPPYVVELTATISNREVTLAAETPTRFWARGADMDRELRMVFTPAVPPGDEVKGYANVGCPRPLRRSCDYRDCRRVLAD